MTTKQIKLLIVDDSLLMQRILMDIFRSDREISVVGSARNGKEALTRIADLNPDVVTMDIEMPEMDGLTAVSKIMESMPVPIVMVSTHTQQENQITLKALDCGAVDFVHKPSGPISLDMDAVKTELLSKVKTAALANILTPKSKGNENLVPSIKNCDKIISITASTGGPPAVSQILKVLPANTPPILIVQHMPKGMTKHFALGLNSTCRIQVKEAEEGDAIQKGVAFIAPGDFHMAVTKDHKITLNQQPLVNYVRPSGDVLMTSAADVYESRNIGVILTGMGADGAAGIKAIKSKGGVTIAQDERTSVVFGMPKVAVQSGCVDVVAPIDLIPVEIMKACN